MTPFAFAILMSVAQAKTMIIIGDSLTTGQGVRREDAYPAVLARKIDALGKAWTVVPEGMNGSVTASAPDRVAVALRNKPDLLILALGGNDGLRRVPLTVIETNLANALTLAQRARVKTLLVGLRVPAGIDLGLGGSVDEMFVRLARRFDVPLLPSMLEGVAFIPEMNQADGYHPNAAGHALIAEHVLSAVGPLL